MPGRGGGRRARGALAAAASVYKQVHPSRPSSDTAGGLRRVAVLAVHGHAISQLAFSPDGALLAVQEAGASVVVFDVATLSVHLVSS